MNNIKLTVNDNDFWHFVSTVQWTTDHSYVRIKRFLLNESNQATCDAIRNKSGELMEALERAVGDKIHGVSDDGWSDVRAHIIGSGREIYESCLESPTQVQHIIDRDEYVENFLYSIPYDDEWKIIQNAPHNAREILGALIDAETPVAATDRLILGDVIGRLQLIVQEDFEAAVDGWDKSLYKLWNNEFPMNYRAPNLINDLKKYHF